MSENHQLFGTEDLRGKLSEHGYKNTDKRDLKRPFPVYRGLIFILFVFLILLFFVLRISPVSVVLRGGASLFLSNAFSFHNRDGSRLRKPCGMRSSTISASLTSRYRSAVSLYERSPCVAVTETRLPCDFRTAIRSLPHLFNKQPRGFPRLRV